MLFSPTAKNSCSCFCTLWKSQSLSSVAVVMASSLSANQSATIFSPFFCVSRLSRRKMACILPLALAVDTKLIHDGFTCCDFDVRISTWSPLCSLWLSGTSLWLTLAPMQWLPRKVCIWNAKSRAVHPAGKVLISPLGVNTKISLAKRLSLMVSRKSMASGCGSSRISLMVLSQLLSSLSSSTTTSPSLYFQWAANPCSATSSMWSERICTSIHLPCFDMRVTCSA